MLGYLIEANNLNKKSSLEWQPIVTLRNGRQDRYELSFTQLSPSSQYQFRVMSFNRVGISEPAYPNKLYGGTTIVSTPSHLELRTRMPYYRETWFVILCACLSVIITIMVIAALCVHNKTYKYKKEAMKNNGSTGSQDRLSELGFGLDDNFDNPLGTGIGQTLEMEMRGMVNSNGHNGSTIGLIMSNNNITTTTLNNRNDRTRSTLQRNNRKDQSKNILNTAAISAQARQPPRPCPGSFSYSDEEDLDNDDRDDIKPPPGLYDMSSGNDSLTEKPSELSSTGPDSEDSDDHDDLVAANMFVNHYANVNDTLRKGLSWKKQAKPYIVPTGSQQNINRQSKNPLPPPSHPPPPQPTLMDQNRSKYKPLPYPPPPPPALPNTSNSEFIQTQPQQLSSSQHYHNHRVTTPSQPLASSSNLSASQHNIVSGQTSTSKFINALNQSSSQSSINRIGFPNRPAPAAPTNAPPSYLSALSGGSGTESEIDTGPSPSGLSNNQSGNALNGGRIIVNNMAGSRAPLPGFSSFV